MRFASFKLFVLLLALFSIMCFASAEDHALPTLDDFDAGWNTVDAGGETVCARGEPYRFFVRKAESPENLMVYFQGGGACWNPLTCRTDSGLFDESVGDLASEVGGYGGIFDFSNASSPISDYSVVFVSYCTGDIHIGNAEVAYNDALTIQHRGQVNSRAVLDWTFENFPDAENVLIAGTSAGGYGAIYYVPEIVEAYPDARIVHMSDAAVGVTPPGWNALETWNIFDGAGADLGDVSAFTGNSFYEQYAAMYPDVVFSQFTTIEDEVQTTFYNFSAFGAAPWQEGMYQYINALNTAFENFASYLAPGEMHVILPRPEYYTLEVDGVRFADWFAALVNGDPVEDVVCEECPAQASEETGSD